MRTPNATILWYSWSFRRLACSFCYATVYTRHCTISKKIKSHW